MLLQSGRSNMTCHHIPFAARQFIDIARGAWPRRRDEYLIGQFPGFAIFWLNERNLEPLTIADKVVTRLLSNLQSRSLTKSLATRRPWATGFVSGEWHQYSKHRVPKSQWTATCNFFFFSFAILVLNLFRAKLLTFRYVHVSYAQNWNCIFLVMIAALGNPFECIADSSTLFLILYFNIHNEIWQQ